MKDRHLLFALLSILALVPHAVPTDVDNASETATSDSLRASQAVSLQRQPFVYVKTHKTG